MAQNYTYLIKHKPTGKFYYGVRFTKNCDPKEFWVNSGVEEKFVIPINVQVGFERGRLI